MRRGRLPKSRSLAVDAAWTGERDILGIFRVDEVFGAVSGDVHDAALGAVVAHLGASKQHGSGLKVEGYVALENDGAGAISPGAEVHHAATCLRAGVNGG